MSLWENWDVDFIGKRAVPLALPPLRMKKTAEELNAPLQDKHLKSLLEVAPERHLHARSLHILHDISDVTRPSTSDRELLHRLRENVGRKQGTFDYELLNDYVFQIRHHNKTVRSQTPKHHIRKVKSAVNLSLIHEGKFGVKDQLHDLSKVRWNSSQHGNVPSTISDRYVKVKNSRDSYVASSSSEALQKALLKQIYPHVRRVRQSQKAQQKAWLTFVKLAAMPKYTTENLQTDRLKRIFRSKATSLIIKVQRKWRKNHRRLLQQRLDEADGLKKHFWRLFITMRCRYRVRMAKYVRSFCKQYANTSKRFVVVMKKTRYRIVKLQRTIRAFIACNNTRKVVMRKLFEKRIHRRYWPIKAHALYYHKKMLSYEDYKNQLEADFLEQERMEAERLRREREASAVQNLDTSLYKNPGRKPLEKHSKQLERWKEQVREKHLMNNYNKKLNHLRQMLSSFGEYQNAKHTLHNNDDKLNTLNESKSTTTFITLPSSRKKKNKEDIQKILGEISGRKFPRFKRLTKEEKEEKEKLLNQTPLEKLHRDFHVYKIPHRIVKIFIELAIHLFRLWHVKHAKGKLEDQDGFNLNDIKKLFDFSSPTKTNDNSNSKNMKNAVTTAEVFEDIDNRGKWPLMKLYSTLDDNRFSALAVILSVSCLTYKGGAMDKMNQATKIEIIDHFNTTIGAINVQDEDHSTLAAAERLSTHKIYDKAFDFINYLDNYDVLTNPIKSAKKKKMKKMRSDSIASRGTTATTASRSKGTSRGTSGAMSAFRKNVHFANDSSSGW